MSDPITRKWMEGPVPKERADRLDLAHELSERARLRFRATAVGIYGSVARSQDGPCSDIEILCAVRGECTDKRFEWIHDGWKIEVDVRGRELLLRDAATVCEDWAITHASYLDIRPVHDPDGFFAELRQTLRETPLSAFDEALERLFVDELYEAIAKLRNARARGEDPPPGFVYFILKIGYQAIGLANRRTYSTATRAPAEALTFPDRMDGYDALCRMAIAGEVADPVRVFEACETFWRGAAAWASARGLSVESPAHLL